MNNKMMIILVAAIVATLILFVVSYFFGFEWAVLTGFVALIALKAAG